MRSTLTNTSITRPGGSVASPSTIAVDRISKSFETHDGLLPVLKDINFSASSGEFVSIIGPSGCGKSTLFNILAGVEFPSSGRVMCGGNDCTGKPGHVGYMLQKDLLLPWKSVLDNTILGLELAGVPRRAARDEARGWFARFGLDGFEREYPAALSGGMRQRAALLRTFLTGRGVLLLDEPFGSLDALTRMDMQEWLLDVRDEFNKTVVLVTHDIDEALFLADRVWVLSPRPAEVVATLEISLPRPRQYEDAFGSRDMIALKQRLLSLLRHAAGRERP